MKRWMRLMLDSESAFPPKAVESLAKLTVRSMMMAFIILERNFMRARLIVFPKWANSVSNKSLSLPDVLRSVTIGNRWEIFSKVTDSQDIMQVFLPNYLVKFNLFCRL
jgi:hypothetical protein